MLCHYLLTDLVLALWCIYYMSFNSTNSGEHFTKNIHYSDIIMSTIASQITSISIVCSTVGSGTDQRKYRSFASLGFVWGIHQWLVNSPHKWTVTLKSVSIWCHHHVDILPWDITTISWKLLRFVQLNHNEILHAMTALQIFIRIAFFI